MTLNCYHLGLLLSLLEKRRAHHDSCTVGRLRENVSPHTNADLCRILFRVCFPLTSNLLFLQQSSSVDQMCHSVRWEILCFSGVANKAWQMIGWAIHPVCARVFPKRLYVTLRHLPCGEAGQPDTLFWRIYCDRSVTSCIRLKIMFCSDPRREDLWSCPLEHGYCGLLGSCWDLNAWTTGITDTYRPRVRVAPLRAYVCVRVHVSPVTLNYNYSQLQTCK